MFALHAQWRADRRLAVWAETSATTPGPHPFAVPADRLTRLLADGGPGDRRLAVRAETSGLRPGPPGPEHRRGARSRAAARSVPAGPHPFAVPADRLARLLADGGPGLAWLAGQATAGSAALPLPTSGGRPQPSPELRAIPAPDASAATLVPWTVPVLLFTPGQAAQLLGELSHADLPDLPYGGSVRWLVAAHDLAWRLVGRGRLLPELTRESGHPHARWHPAPDPPAHQDLSHLTSAIPPALLVHYAASGATAPYERGSAAGAGASAGEPASSGAERSAPGERGPSDGGEPAGAAGSGSAASEEPGRSAGGHGPSDRGEPAGEPASGGFLPAAARGDVQGRLHRDGVAASGGAAADESGRSAGVRGAGGGDADLPGGALLAGEIVGALVDGEARAALEDGGSLVRGGGAWGVAESWVAALGAGDGRMEGAETGGLEERLAAWHRSAAADDTPLRLCFRLAEPLGAHQDDDGWRLDFLVQAVDEPSLTVEAGELWAPGPALTALERYAEEPARLLLDALNRASRSYGALRTALAQERPAGLPLDRAGALAFLREAAPALAEAGFGVLLPTWWQRRPALGLALTVREPQPGTVETAGLADRDSIVAFRWQAALGDQVLTEKELTALAAARQPLVRLRGQWTEVDPARIAAALAFLERAGTGIMTSGQALRIALEPGAAEAGFTVIAVTADDPADRLRGLGALLRGSADHRPEPVAVPAAFTATLRPYQQRGLDWLAFLSRLGLGAVLADDMGLGKTAQTLALLAAEREQEGQGEEGRDEEAGDAPTAPTLVVCPMSLVGNWRRETAVFTPKLRVHVHHGATRHTGAQLAAAVRGADVVITTYGLVQRDQEALAAVTWRRVVIDEAQNVKNSSTHQYRALRAIPARQRIALTGTPVENRLAELHALLDLVNPGLFGTAGAFKERFAIPVERDGDVTVAAELRRRTGPFVLRRLKTDPAIARELPAKQHIRVVCNLTAEQAALYRAVVADMLARIDETRGLRRRAHVLAALGKLKQVCNHPAHFLADGSPLDGRSGKLARLEETLEEALAEGDKTLCFTQYAAFGALLRPHLARRLGTEVLFLHGGDPPRAREEMVARFQDPAGPRVFLLSLKAGGTGLNLTAARQVVHIDRWWNPAVEDQATDRAFRIGQRRDVQVRTFVCAGTVEERIDAMIEAKRSLADAAVGSVGAGGTAAADWLAELSTAELRDVLRLSEEEAVSE